MKIIFFGTAPFAAELLKFLLEKEANSDLCIAAIVTKPDRPQKRSSQPIPCAVKKCWMSHASSRPLLQPEIASSEDFAKHLASFEADLFLVVAYGEIIKQHLLDMPPLGCINVHGSLLPKLRGAAPIQRSIINGDTISGVTIMQMVKKMDAGDMIRTASVPIGCNTTAGELERDLCDAAKPILLEVLEEYAAGEPPPHTPQNPSEVTFAKKIEVDECCIDWQRPAFEIHNLIRGVTPIPGAWCYVAVKGIKKRLKIADTHVIEDCFGTAGTFLQWDSNGIVIACGSGALAVGELRLEGKRAMSAKEFVRGVDKETIALG